MCMAIRRVRLGIRAGKLTWSGWQERWYVGAPVVEAVPLARLGHKFLLGIHIHQVIHLVRQRPLLFRRRRDIGLLLLILAGHSGSCMEMKNIPVQDTLTSTENT